MFPSRSGSVKSGASTLGGAAGDVAGPKAQTPCAASATAGCPRYSANAARSIRPARSSIHCFLGGIGTQISPRQTPRGFHSQPVALSKSAKESQSPPRSVEASGIPVARACRR